jgi:sialidase-1
MNIKKYTISCDPDNYEAWPDIVLTNTGKLICVFSECIHHNDRSYTRIMLTESTDRGRTWSPKHPLTEGTANKSYYYNCPRISRLKNGRLAVIIDKMPHYESDERVNEAINIIYFSDDDGISWSNPVETPLKGIVPDKIVTLDNGRILISAHRLKLGRLAQFLRYSDDDGRNWSEEVTVASDPRYDLCEVSLLPLNNGCIVAFMRENSRSGYDCKKTISFDNGENWGAIIDFPLPGCHRPVAGLLNNGKLFITYRFLQGGKGWGNVSQNFLAALSDRESALAVRRNDAWTRIIPVDYDASPYADLGYSGWVEFPDGEVYIASYIVDNAINKAQIRGYSIHPDDFKYKLPDGT